MHFNIQLAHVFPSGKRLEASKTKILSVTTFTCWKGKLLILGLCPLLPGEDRYDYDEYLTVTLHVSISAGFGEPIPASFILLHDNNNKCYCIEFLFIY